MRFDFENVIGSMAIALFVFGLAVVGYFTFSTKEFKGYYLCQGERGYRICINWENGADEVAFSSMDPKEILAVYDNLVKSGKAVK